MYVHIITRAQENRRIVLYKTFADTILSSGYEEEGTAQHCANR